jgi:hypothetical protein
LLFGDFVDKKRPKKCPKITNLDQNQSFWPTKSKIGPKSKFRFLQFLKNDPKLISSQFLASQHHFCKSLSDFHFFMKFTQNHQFWLKTLKKWAKNIFFIIFFIFSQNITKKACLNQIRAYNDIFSLKYSLSYKLPFVPFWLYLLTFPIPCNTKKMQNKKNSNDRHFAKNAFFSIL